MNDKNLNTEANLRRCRAFMRDNCNAFESPFDLSDACADALDIYLNDETFEIPVFIQELAKTYYPGE
jgi:hypothetical protein